MAMKTEERGSASLIAGACLFPLVVAAGLLVDLAFSWDSVALGDEGMQAAAMAAARDGDCASISGQAAAARKAYAGVAGHEPASLELSCADGVVTATGSDEQRLTILSLFGSDHVQIGHRASARRVGASYPAQGAAMPGERTP